MKTTEVIIEEEVENLAEPLIVIVRISSQGKLGKYKKEVIRTLEIAIDKIKST